MAAMEQIASVFKIANGYIVVNLSDERNIPPAQHYTTPAMVGEAIADLAEIAGFRQKAKSTEADAEAAALKKLFPTDEGPLF